MVSEKSIKSSRKLVYSCFFFRFEIEFAVRITFQTRPLAPKKNKKTKQIKLKFSRKTTTKPESRKRKQRVPASSDNRERQCRESTDCSRTSSERPGRLSRPLASPKPRAQSPALGPSGSRRLILGQRRQSTGIFCSSSSRSN